RIVESHRESTVVALSVDAAAQQRALEAGAKIFLLKPVERASLVGVLDRASRTSQRRVLVVDDDPDALDLAVAMIEDSGYEIETATSGSEALDSIESQRPD